LGGIDFAASIIFETFLGFCHVLIIPILQLHCSSLAYSKTTEHSVVLLN
jgi:hypothetical protein